MTSGSKLGLFLLGAVALACLALIALRDEGSETDGPVNDLTAGEDLGGRDTRDGAGLRAGATPGSTNGGPMTAAGTGGPGDLVGARTPEGIDYSNPETREAELRRLLGVVPVDDWLGVAKVVALMPAGEPIPADLRGVILDELRTGKRLQAMHVFAKLNDASFVEDLFEMIEGVDANQALTRAALEALWKMPAGDDDAIARRLESSLAGDTRKDGRILRAIGKRGGAEGARAIVEYLQRVKNPSDVNVHILQSLDISTDAAAAEIVIEALQREASGKVQRALLAMVMRPGTSAVTEAVIGLDRDGVSDDVRTMTLRTLGRIGDAKAAEYLLKKSAEAGSFGEQALTAVAGLNTADPRVGDLLSQALADADRNPRPALAKSSLLRALGNAKHTASLPTVARSLADRDPTVQTAAIRAMGRMGDAAQEYIPRLVTLYDSGDARRRQSVAAALTGIGGTAAIEQMRTMLKVEDLDPSVRRTLQVGLRAAEDRLPKAPK